MPIYHFTVDDEREGEAIELENVDVAKCQAVKLAGRVICDEHADTFWESGEWTMTVTNAEHLTLFQLLLIGSDSPVLRKTSPG